MPLLKAMSVSESPLDIILLLDGICLPFAIEWANNQGFGDYLYFLLETDAFRYKIADTDTIRNLNSINNLYLSDSITDKE